MLDLARGAPSSRCRPRALHRFRKMRTETFRFYAACCIAARKAARAIGAVLRGTLGSARWRNRPASVDTVATLVSGPNGGTQRYAVLDPATAHVPASFWGSRGH